MAYLFTLYFVSLQSALKSSSFAPLSVSILLCPPFELWQGISDEYSLSFFVPELVQFY